MELLELAIDRLAAIKAGRTGMWRDDYWRDKKRFKDEMWDDLAGIPLEDYEEVSRFFIEIAFPVRGGSVSII